MVCLLFSLSESAHLKKKNIKILFEFSHGHCFTVQREGFHSSVSQCKTARAGSKKCSLLAVLWKVILCM